VVYVWRHAWGVSHLLLQHWKFRITAKNAITIVIVYNLESADDDGFK